MNIISQQPGTLVLLSPGEYPIIKSETKQRHILSISERKQALLLELQGAEQHVYRPYRLSTAEAKCWYALVEGDIVVVWDDQLVAS